MSQPTLSVEPPDNLLPSTALTTEAGLSSEMRQLALALTEHARANIAMADRVQHFEDGLVAFGLAQERASVAPVVVPLLERLDEVRSRQLRDGCAVLRLLHELGRPGDNRLQLVVRDDARALVVASASRR